MPALRAIIACSALWGGVGPGIGVVMADVFKCAGDAGVPIYQESPCPPGKELRNFQVDPPQITVLPAPALTLPPPAKAPEGPTRPNARARDASAGPNGAVPKGDATERKHIRAGMSEAEVLARLGAPDVSNAGKNRKGSRWTYLPAPGDPNTITTLTFSNGTVAGVERKVYRK